MTTANVPAVRESTALADREETTGELQQTASEAAVVQEIQGALIVAKKFPRDEDRAYQAIIRSAQRLSFAQEVEYSYPRAGEKIHGPSIYFAREFARVWGNIRHGCDIIYDDPQRRTIRAWAWDLQTNTKVSADDAFEKVVWRKKGGPDGRGGWVVPDERDLRELTNRRAAIAKRNCILELLPSDMVNDAICEATETLQKKVKEDPDTVRKSVLKSFGALNVTAEDLKAFLGTDVSKASPAQLVELRKVYKSIADGQATWADYQKSGADGANANAGGSRTDGVAEKLKQKAGKGEPAAPAPEKEDLAQADAINDACRDLDTKIDGARNATELNAAGADMLKARELIGEERYAMREVRYRQRFEELTQKPAPKSGMFA